MLTPSLAAYKVRIAVPILFYEYLAEECEFILFQMSDKDFGESYSIGPTILFCMRNTHPLSGLDPRSKTVGKLCSLLIYPYVTVFESELLMADYL